MFGNCRSRLRQLELLPVLLLWLCGSARGQGFDVPLDEEAGGEPHGADIEAGLDVEITPEHDADFEPDAYEAPDVDFAPEPVPEAAPEPESEVRSDPASGASADVARAPSRTVRLRSAAG